MKAVKRRSSEKSDGHGKKTRASNNEKFTSKYFSSSGEADETSDGNETDSSKSSSRLPFHFFNRPCSDLAKALLGKKFVRKMPDGNTMAATIVETEAYLGGEDKAAHSYNGKRTERNEAMYMKPGTIYVYNIYGMYTCINISSQGTILSFIFAIYCEGKCKKRFESKWRFAGYEYLVGAN